MPNKRTSSKNQNAKTSTLSTYRTGTNCALCADQPTPDSCSTFTRLRFGQLRLGTMQTKCPCGKRISAAAESAAESAGSKHSGAEPSAGANWEGGLGRLLELLLLVVCVPIGVLLYWLPILCAVLAAGRRICLRSQQYSADLCIPSTHMKLVDMLITACIGKSQ